MSEPTPAPARESAPLRGGRDPLKVLVAGAGAIGQWLGLRMMQAGHDVTLLARPVHADAIRRDGLRVRGISEMHGHPTVVTEPTERLGKYDAILLTCKAHQTAGLAPLVAPLLEDNGAFATLQNGFGNAQKISASVPAARIVFATTSHGVMPEGPGRLLHAGAGPTIVGPHRPEGETAARRVLELLDHAGLAPEWSQDMRGPVWRKALVNHAANPVAALHQSDNGGLLREPAWGQCVELIDEGFAISRSAGVGMPGVRSAADLTAALRATLERTRGNRNSMVQDVASQRPTEVEQISGRLVRLARRLGIAAPHSDAIYRSVKAVEAKYLGDEVSLRMARTESEWESEPF